MKKIKNRIMTQEYVDVLVKDCTSATLIGETIN